MVDGSPGEAGGADARRPTAGARVGVGSAASGLRCDFCGELVGSVRRVALDRDYDRLRKLHRELYACGPCSRRKEQERLGLARS